MKLQITKRTISAVQRVITGNPVTIDGMSKALGPYRSGPSLVEFFNELGGDDVYSFQGGAPSRWAYAESKLEELNGKPALISAIEAAVHPAAFLDTGLDAFAAVAYLNQYLKHEGLELVQAGAAYRVRRSGETLVDVEAQLAPDKHASHEFIAEQIAKCDRKLREEDYDGAITNARSAAEAVLTDIEARLDSSAPAYDGDLLKLYKRVQKLLHLEPERPELAESLRQLLRGLASIIGGLAPLRNKMGDAHVRTYKPARHHAKLAVNAAKTFLDFVYDTFEYQKTTGRITEIEPTKK